MQTCSADIRESSLAKAKHAHWDQQMEDFVQLAEIIFVTLEEVSASWYLSKLCWTL